jgi:hypothetical protein
MIYLKGSKMTEQAKPWANFGYEPVGAIVNKLLARYLRTQRKNMKRFFEERGLYALADRMKQIRNSRQGMIAKNRYFQEVLNEYAKLTNPVTVSDGSTIPGNILHQQAPAAASEPQAADQ